MGICGIIAEYDPLHNGHAWQLSEARRLTGAEKIICVLSGSFTQRGMPALFSAHTRAAMALNAGADIVLGLPFSFSVCDALRFAEGGVHILKQAGADSLCFGVEPEGIHVFEQAALLLEHPTPLFRERMHTYLSRGFSFARAQGEALAAGLQVENAVLSQPNTVLAICYARANLRQCANLQLYPVPRSGQYHSVALPVDGAFPSASAIRAAIDAERWEEISLAVPTASYRLMREAAESGRLCKPGALDALLRWKLRQTADFSKLPDLSEGIENRLHQAAATALTREQMVQAVKSKRYPYARINRLLTHVLMETDASQLETFPAYAYLLGFRKGASQLLRRKKDAPFQFYPTALPHPVSYDMQLDIRANDLWAVDAGMPFGGIFREKPVIL